MDCPRCIYQILDLYLFKGREHVLKIQWGFPPPFQEGQNAFLLAWIHALAEMVGP